MAEDLLTRIQRELQERIEQLHSAVQERDRLQADLNALDAAPEPSVASEPPAVQDVDPETPAAVFCFPARSEPARTHSVSPQAGQMAPPASRPARQRIVSPKVARLMLAPRRPALERSGIARVGGRTDRTAVSLEELLEDVDSEAELYERSM